MCIFERKLQIHRNTGLFKVNLFETEFCKSCCTLTRTVSLPFLKEKNTSALGERNNGPDPFFKQKLDTLKYTPKCVPFQIVDAIGSWKCEDDPPPRHRPRQIVCQNCVLPPPPLPCSKWYTVYTRGTSRSYLHFKEEFSHLLFLEILLIMI